MPIYFKDTDVLSQVRGLKSVLIVPCRFCPAATLAVREGKPYIELLRKFLRTEAYEDYVQALKDRLEGEGIRTVVFDSRLLHQFVACMWTTKRRNQLAKRAAQFEGALALGCKAMVQMVRDAVDPTGCQIIQGMEAEGIMNVVPVLDFPANISLDVQGVVNS
jgi:hypothetical protein